MVERHGCALVNHLDGKGWAGHIVRDAHASSNTFGELCLSCAQVSREHQHVSCLQEFAQNLTKSNSLLGGSRDICASCGFFWQIVRGGVVVCSVVCAGRKVSHKSLLEGVPQANQQEVAGRL